MGGRVMRTVDFFSGLGGFSEGARQAGADVILAANHNPTAVEWHTANHPGTRHAIQDLGEMDMRALPAHDLLLASPCCQGFSPSGRPGRPGAARFDRDKALARRQVARNTSFAVLAAADVARPARIVVENVPEFLEWEAFDAWRGMLEAFGYAVEAHVVDARNFGSAQARKRAILTASLDGPIRLDVNPAEGRRTVADCLIADDDPSARWKPLRTKTEGIQARIARARERAGGVERFLWANVDSARARTMDDAFPTLTTKSLSQLHLVEGDRVRRLEAREAARAMSFPDTYSIPTNREDAGRLIGNAIDVAVSRGVVEQVLAA